MKAAKEDKISSVNHTEMVEGKRYIGLAFGIFTVENGQVFFESPINGAVYTVDPIFTAPFYDFDSIKIF